MSRHPDPLIRRRTTRFRLGISRPTARRPVARLMAMSLAALIGLTAAATMAASPASAADAPYCPSGKTPSFRFRDNMENPASGKWAFTHALGNEDWTNDTEGATSGTRSLHTLQGETLTD